MATASLNFLPKLLIVLLIGSIIIGCSKKNVTTSDVPKNGAETTGLYDAYWKLMSINGEAVKATAPKEAHIIISAAKQVTGNSGCNSFGGSAVMPGENAISFPNLFSTKMACMGVDENTFFEALNKVAFYARENNMLYFKSSDGKILLTFIHK
jgi:heat shock protein HslJ